MKKLSVSVLVCLLLATCACTPSPTPMPEMPERFNSEITVSFKENELSGVFERLGSSAFSIAVEKPEALAGVTILYSDGKLSLSAGEISLGVDASQAVLPEAFPAAVLSELLALGGTEPVSLESEDGVVCSEYEATFGKTTVCRREDASAPLEIKCDKLELYVSFSYTPAQIAAIRQSEGVQPSF